MSSIYLLLFIVLVLFSWVGSVYGLTLSDGSLMPNLLSEEGVRWFVRHSMDNISAAPFAEAVLGLLAVGALRSSGLWYAIWHRSQLVQRQRHALLVSLVLMAVCASVVVWGIIPGGNLLSVMGHLSGGPFATGWPFLLWLIVIVPSIVFGRMCGQWRTTKDLYVGFTSAIVSYSNYFVTLIVASQLVASMHYVRLFYLIGFSQITQNLCIGALYAIPLIILFVTNRFQYDTSSTE